MKLERKVEEARYEGLSGLLCKAIPMLKSYQVRIVGVVVGSQDDIAPIKDSNAIAKQEILLTHWVQFKLNGVCCKIIGENPGVIAKRTAILLVLHALHLRQPNLHGTPFKSSPLGKHLGKDREWIAKLLQDWESNKPVQRYTPYEHVLQRLLHSTLGLVFEGVIVSRLLKHQGTTRQLQRLQDRVLAIYAQDKNETSIGIRDTKAISHQHARQLLGITHTEYDESDDDVFDVNEFVSRVEAVFKSGASTYSQLSDALGKRRSMKRAMLFCIGHDFFANDLKFKRDRGSNLSDPRYIGDGNSDHVPMAARLFRDYSTELIMGLSGACLITKHGKGHNDIGRIDSAGTAESDEKIIRKFELICAAADALKAARSPNALHLPSLAQPCITSSRKRKQRDAESYDDETRINSSPRNQQMELLQNVHNKCTQNEPQPQMNVPHTTGSSEFANPQTSNSRSNRISRRSLLEQANHDDSSRDFVEQTRNIHPLQDRSVMQPSSTRQQNPCNQPVSFSRQQLLGIDGSFNRGTRSAAQCESYEIRDISDIREVSHPRNQFSHSEFVHWQQQQRHPDASVRETNHAAPYQGLNRNVSPVNSNQRSLPRKKQRGDAMATKTRIHLRNEHTHNLGSSDEHV